MSNPRDVMTWQLARPYRGKHVAPTARRRAVVPEGVDHGLERPGEAQHRGSGVRHPATRRLSSVSRFILFPTRFVVGGECALDRARAPVAERVGGVVTAPLLEVPRV